VPAGRQAAAQPVPLHHDCPRWDGPEDYHPVMEETEEQTEIAGLLSPDLWHLGPA
jgi:hypothetical protein